MEEYVKILQEMILDDDFIVIKFFRRIDCAFSQKDQAEECFREALKILVSKDDEYSRKAKNLLGNFDNYVNSYSIRQYWNGLKIREERDKSRTDQFLLEEKKEQHLCLIDSNVITEHNHSSNRLTLESSKSKLNDEIDNFFQSNPEQRSTNPIKKRRKSETISNEQGISNEADNEKDKAESEAQNSISISEEDDSSDYIPISEDDENSDYIPRYHNNSLIEFLRFFSP
ncbi:hypothetical protein C1646_459381 [Rhizophagus diaphanus]|nr:hypothetical protein C1646_459381 [Rhizophagus diaphanus] [Rhizophagus sp. MUCL 43196]